MNMYTRARIATDGGTDSGTITLPWTRPDEARSPTSDLFANKWYLKHPKVQSKHLLLEFLFAYNQVAGSETFEQAME